MSVNHCPKCGTEMVERDPDKLDCPACGHWHYNPEKLFPGKKKP